MVAHKMSELCYSFNTTLEFTTHNNNCKLIIYNSYYIGTTMVPLII